MSIAATERDFQAAVVEAARLLGWRVYHTFDSRHSAAGFPDLVLCRDRVVFAELKVGGGRLTNQQAEWLAALEQAGAEAYVWRADAWADVVGVLKSRAARSEA